jgi:hypothetical protein
MDQLQNTQPRHHFVPATTTTSSYSKNLLCDLYDGRKHNQTNTNFSQTPTFWTQRQPLSRQCVMEKERAKRLIQSTSYTESPRWTIPIIYCRVPLRSWNVLSKKLVLLLTPPSSIHTHTCLLFRRLSFIIHARALHFAIVYRRVDLSPYTLIHLSVIKRSHTDLHSVIPSLIIVNGMSILKIPALPASSHKAHLPPHCHHDPAYRNGLL